jgi:phosphohistidine swiveling domain-containing protein
LFDSILEFPAEDHASAPLLSGKAETLARLATRLPPGTIPPGVVLTREHIESDRCGAVAIVLRDLAGARRLIVRSSAADEDRAEASSAGRYLSVPDVAPNMAEVLAAIDQVMASMAAGGASPADAVLVQPMLSPALTAVVLTREPRSGAPYLLIAADRSARTDVVTAGRATRRLAVLHGHEARLEGDVGQVARLARATMAAAGHDALNLEVIVDDAGVARLVQARRLRCPPIPRGFGDALDGAARVLREMTDASPVALGSGVALSDMADWNPGEIVGTAPSPLAFSTYRALIGTSAWRVARAGLGYRDPGVPLLHRLGAHPYVDVRASLTSLVPSAVKPETAERLVAAGLDALRAEPGLHTRLEFALSCSCTGFEPEGAPALIAARLDRSDIERLAAAAAEITERLAARRDGFGLTELSQTFASPAHQPAPADNGRVRAADIAGRVRHAVAHAAVPFAVAARHAFVAERLLSGLVDREALSTSRAVALRASVVTVATRCARDLQAVRSGRLGIAEFFAVYGHLRPGTYDVRSWRYRDIEPDALAAGASSTLEETPPFEPTPAETRAIKALCRSCGLRIEAAALLDYIVSAIALREDGKFLLARHVSELLEAVAAHAATFGLNRDDASLLDLQLLMRDDAYLASGVEALRDRHVADRALITPGVVLSERDLVVIREDAVRPTFTTSRRVRGRVVVIDAQTRPGGRSLDGAIVCAERLDPGFEWLFGQSFAGLVVRYCGPNSHVAIRCHELGIPAALGCTPERFTAVLRAAEVEIDCAAETVTAL